MYNITMMTHKIRCSKHNTTLMPVKIQDLNTWKSVTILIDSDKVPTAIYNQDDSFYKSLLELEQYTIIKLQTTFSIEGVYESV